MTEVVVQADEGEQPSSRGNNPNTVTQSPISCRCYDRKPNPHLYVGKLSSIAKDRVATNEESVSKKKETRHVIIAGNTYHPVQHP